MKVFGKDTREGGLEFSCIWPASVQFHNPATKIAAEGEVNESNLVVELHDHCGLVVFYNENGKISVFVYLDLLYYSSERSNITPA